MKIDKDKLMQEIEAMREKLASMEEELNKPEEVEEFKHFPSKGDAYFHYYPSGIIGTSFAQDDNIKPNAYKTTNEVKEAYDKAVAVEKIKRRIIELQGDWKPDWKDSGEKKAYIKYYHYSGEFEIEYAYFVQNSGVLPYIKDKDIAETIIKEMQDELELVFDIY